MSDRSTTDLRSVFRVLRKRGWIGLLVMVAVIAGGVFATSRADRVYEAESTLFVGQRQISSAQLAQSVQLSQLSTNLLRSYAEILSSRAVATRAVESGGLLVRPERISSGISAEPLIDTQVIRLAYRSTDPQQAAAVVNAVADAFVGEIAGIDAIEGGAPALTVSVVDEALVPTSPVSPRPVLNLAVAIVLGLSLGAGVVWLFEALDTTVKGREDVEALEVAVIGTIPPLPTSGQDVYLEHDAQEIGGEAFRKIRTTIGFLALERELNSILITSPAPREGKTTVALNVAAAFAHGGFSTVLVEADLRRPSLHHLFGSRGMRGLTPAIVGSMPIEEAVRTTNVKGLSVMLAGAVPPNPVELLGSQQMSELIERLKAMYDTVIIDSPPIGPVADPAAVASKCDGSVIVARAGKTDRRALIESVGVLQRSGGRLLGVIVNHQRHGETNIETYQYTSYTPSSTGFDPHTQASA